MTSRINVTNLRYMYTVTTVIPREGFLWVSLGGCPKIFRLTVRGTLQMVKYVSDLPGQA